MWHGADIWQQPGPTCACMWTDGGTSKLIKQSVLKVSACPDGACPASPSSPAPAAAACPATRATSGGRSTRACTLAGGVGGQREGQKGAIDAPSTFQQQASGQATFGDGALSALSKVSAAGKTRRDRRRWAKRHSACKTDQLSRAEMGDGAGMVAEDGRECTGTDAPAHKTTPHPPATWA